MSTDACELTILMPCLNESLTVGRCIEKAKAFLARSGIRGEVVVADNGSTDGSQALAERLGARVVAVPVRGYGAALIAGIDAAQGRYVVMGDSDDSYDFSRLDSFLAELRRGAELVIGNRFQGGILPGAMPALHRYLGNPVLSFIGRLLHRTPVRDFHCGLRGFSRDSIRSLGLFCDGMEFASEMVVQASIKGLRIAEVPTVLSPDGRDRPPHLRSWPDGWRHLKFLLLLSPRWLFLYPGMMLLTLGSALMAALFGGPLAIGRIGLDIHTMLYAAAAAIIGFQMLSFALFTKLVGMARGLLPRDSRIEKFLGAAMIDRGLLVGLICVAAGAASGVYSVLLWERAAFGPLDPTEVMRFVIPSVALCVIGAQTMLTSAFLGVLAMAERAGGRTR